jgi:hypothetical protein
MGPMGPGAAKKDAKAGSLEKTLAEALKNNADVRVAEAKLREAEAELNRARMQVMQKVVSLRASLEKQQAEVDHATKTFMRLTQLGKQGAVEASIVDEAQLKLAVAKGKLAELQSEYDVVIGKHQATFWIHMSPAGRPVEVDLDAPGGHERAYQRALLWIMQQQDPDGVWGKAHVTTVWADYLTKVHATPGSTADKLRKALDENVSLSCDNRRLADVVKEFQEKHGVPFVLATQAMGETKVTMKITEAPFGAALEMIEDTLPNVRFAVRDYGVLVTGADRLPAGAVPMHTFWKSRAAAEKAAANQMDVEGEIKAVDEKGELVTINIGSKTGLKKGHNLFLYRLKPKPLFLGEIRILDVNETEAVARPKLQSKTIVITVGDKVSSDLKGDKP